MHPGFSEQMIKRGISHLRCYCNRGANEPMVCENNMRIQWNIMFHNSNLLDECTAAWKGHYIFIFGHVLFHTVDFLTPAYDKKLLLSHT